MAKNIGKPLFEFDTGRYFLSTIYQLITLTLILVKLYSNSTILTQIMIAIIVFIGVSLSMWLFGWVLIKYNIIEKFQMENPSVKKMLGRIDEMENKK